MIIVYDKTYEQIHEEITELAKLIYGTRVGCVNISDVFNRIKQLNKDLNDWNNCSRMLGHYLAMPNDAGVDILNEALKVLNSLQRNEEWDGVEPLFVGAIVRLGVVEAVTEREVCIRYDDNELTVHNIGDIQPVKDEADKIVTLYDGSESDSLAGQLRDLKSLGLIEFTL